MENPIKMDDLGVPLFLEAPRYNHLKMYLGVVPLDSHNLHSSKQT